MLLKIKDWLLVVLVFLLPWQTRFIYRYGFIEGRYSEYTTLSFYVTEILLWLVVILFVVNFIKRNGLTSLKKGLKNNQWPIIFILAFLVLIGGRAIVSYNFDIVWQQVVFIMGAVSLAALIVSSDIKWKNLTISLWSAGVVQSLLAVWQFFSQEVTSSKWLGIAYQSAKELGASVIEIGDERWLRAYGSYGSPNTLGIFLAIVWVLGFLLYEKVNQKWRILISAGQCLILTGLILTFSRGAWLAALVGLLFWIVKIVSVRQYAILIKNLIFSCSITVLMVTMLFPLFVGRFNNELRLEDRSLGERQTQYSQARELFYGKPFFGVGLRNYTLALRDKHPEIFIGSLQPVHNSYLLVVTEIGIVGLFFLVWFISGALKGFDWENNGMILAVLAVAALFDHSLWNFYPGLLMAGLTFGLVIKKPPVTS